MTDWLLTACLVAPLVACIGAAFRAVRTRRPAMHYRVGYDALHPLPAVDPRPVPPPLPAAADPRWELVFGPDTIEVARPLGWDAKPRQKEY